MHLLITRPSPDGERLAERLRALGHSCVIEPVMEISPKKSAPDLEGVDALVFTSANGVRAFADVSASRSLPVFAVGDTTAQRAGEAGFSAVESASGTVDSLADLIAEKVSRPGMMVLHIAGTHLAGDLAGRLSAAGVGYRRAVLYEAVARERFSDAFQGALEKGAGFDGVLFYSPRTAALFADLLRRSGLADRACKWIAYCLSGAVRDALGDLPFAEARVAVTPDEDALLSLIAAERNA